MGGRMRGTRAIQQARSISIGTINQHGADSERSQGVTGGESGEMGM
jgi:hypothetical protein